MCVKLAINNTHLFHCFAADHLDMLVPRHNIFRQHTTPRYLKLDTCSSGTSEILGVFVLVGCVGCCFLEIARNCISLGLARESFV